VGVTVVVHTWGRNLSFHPHLHCIVTGGGLTNAGSWVNSREKYLLPVKAMGMLFCGKFLDGLWRLFQQRRLVAGPRHKGDVAALLQTSVFARLKATLYAKDWVVYAKAPFRNSKALFRYLGRYTHRVAISNHRLVGVNEREVAFRTRGDGICRLAPLEFMRRFLQHVLPSGFVKIRHFGLLSAGNVNNKLVAARVCLTPGVAVSPLSKCPPLDWRALLQQLTGIDPTICDHCGGRLMTEPLAEVSSPARAPPSPDS
jgi:hypothetical protein